jgi:hypothetical protein
MRIEFAPRNPTTVHSTLPHAAFGNGACAAIRDGRRAAGAAVFCRIAAREARHSATQVRLQVFDEDAAPLARSGRTWP